jgi:hypothetical protein
MRHACYEQAGGRRVMRRRLFKLAAAASLLLCVATAILWVIGDITGIYISWIRMDPSGMYQTYYAARVSGGGFAFESSFEQPDHSRLGWHAKFNDNDYPMTGPDWGRTWYIDFGEGGFRLAVFPCWSVLLLSLLLPIWWTIRRRAKPAMNRAKCSTCGYNLTGNTSGVCPECGTPVPSKPEAIA